jgi:hypothetical protein
MQRGAHCLLFLVVATHVKELVKIIIIFLLPLAKKFLKFFLVVMRMSKELVDYYFVAMTHKGSEKTSEFNDKI